MLGQHSGRVNPTAHSWPCTLTMNPKHCPSGEGAAHAFRLACMGPPLEASSQIWAPQPCTAFLERGVCAQGPTEQQNATARCAHRSGKLTKRRTEKLALLLGSQGGSK